MARCLAKRLVSFNGGGASISRPSWASSRAERIETVPGQFAGSAAVSHVEAGLENGLDFRTPGAVEGCFCFSFLQR